MTGEEFTNFQSAMGWNKSEISRQFGLSRNTVDRYLVDGAPISIDLACASLAFGLPAWSEAVDEKIAVSKAGLEGLRRNIDELLGARSD